MLTQDQLDELKQQASFLMEMKKLDELSWDRAWAGVYPDTPTGVEVYEEVLKLKAKLSKIRVRGNEITDEDYSDMDELLRMIAIENCVTFSIWKGLF